MGKTSTKEMTAAVLGRKAPTLKTFASYNNEIGYRSHCFAWNRSIVMLSWKWARNG